MGLPKGQTNNPNGRPKGRPNKATKELRDIVTEFLQKNTKDMQEIFDKMQPKDKMMAIERLLSYALPKMQSVDHHTDIGTRLDNLTGEQLNVLIEKLLTEIEDEK